MAVIKKQKIEEINAEEKKQVIKLGKTVILSVVVSCILVIGCISCSLNTDVRPQEMTSVEKLAYWSEAVVDKYWYHVETPNYDAILEGFDSPLDIKTKLDDKTNKLVAEFVTPDENGINIGSAELKLSSEYGLLELEEYQWDVKFSEKNNVMYLVITDGKAKEVHYQTVRP